MSSLSEEFKYKPIPMEERYKKLSDEKIKLALETVFLDKEPLNPKTDADLIESRRLLFLEAKKRNISY